MKKILSSCAIIGAISCTAAMPHENRTNSLNITAVEVGEIVGGVIYGIIQEQYGNLDQCITDVEDIAKDVETAVADFKEESFSGIKDGIAEIGAVVKLVPQAVAQCKEVTGDLTNLVKMAEVFEHPLSLVYHVAKNLIVNGVDVFGKISTGINYYHSGDYFHFGQQMGEALDEVVLKSKSTKQQMDFDTYSFLEGFFAASKANYGVDNQQLYNNIDGLGIMVFGPIYGAMEDFKQNSNKDLKQTVWMGLHEISHSLLEGSESMVAKNAITAADKAEIQKVAMCMNSNDPSGITPEVEHSFITAYRQYTSYNIKDMGATISQIAYFLCKSPKFLS